MKKCLSLHIVLLSLLVASSAVPQAQADVTLPKVIGNHMVLQRDRPLPIWGWAAADEEVTVKTRRRRPPRPRPTPRATGRWCSRP